MTYDINRVLGKAPVAQVTAYDIVKDSQINAIVRTLGDYKNVDLVPLHVRVTSIREDGECEIDKSGSVVSGFVLGGSRGYFACLEAYRNAERSNVPNQELLCHSLDWTYTYFIKRAYGTVESAPNLSSKSVAVIDLDAPSLIYQQLTITASPVHSTDLIDQCLALLLMFNILRKVSPQALSRRIRALFSTQGEVLRTEVEAEFQKRDDFVMWLSGYVDAKMNAARVYQALHESSRADFQLVIKTMAIYLRFYGLQSALFLLEVLQVSPALEEAPIEIQREATHFTDLLKKVTTRDLEFLGSMSDDMINNMNMGLLKYSNSAAWHVLYLKENGSEIVTNFVGYAKNTECLNDGYAKNTEYLNDNIKLWVQGFLAKYKSRRR